jgi:D-alanyl-D-alanine carboxypeptidase
MDRYLTRRSVLALAPGLLVIPSWIKATPAAAQTASPAATPPVGTPTFTTLAEVVHAGVAEGLPGVALAAYRDGGPPVFAAAGVASLERQTPLKATDRFRIYSIAKTFTAIVVLQLVDEGVLSLDDTVAARLTDPAVARIPHTDRITLRQLLNQTSGIYDYFDEDSPFLQDAFLGPNADWAKVWTPQELLAYADGAKHPPYFAPGQGAHYANTNYILLGLLVEQATGRRFADELHTRILAPLALTDTFLAEGAALPSGTVDGYQLLEGKPVDVSALNLSWTWTAGGMVSTTQDLARFADAVFAGTLLKPATFREMFTFRLMRPNVEEGMGVFRTQTPSGGAVGMDGEGPGGSSQMFRLPAAGLTLVLLTNIAPGGAVFETLRDTAFRVALATGTPAAGTPAP